MLSDDFRHLGTTVYYTYEPNYAVLRFHQGGIRNERQFVLPRADGSNQNELSVYYFGAFTGPIIIVVFTLLLTICLCCTCCYSRRLPSIFGLESSRYIRKVGYVAFMILALFATGAISFLMVVEFKSRKLIENISREVIDLTNFVESAAAQVLAIKTSLSDWEQTQNEFETCAATVETIENQTEMHEVIGDIHHVVSLMRNFMGDSEHFLTALSVSFSSQALLSLMAFNFVHLTAVLTLMASATILFFTFDTSKFATIRRFDNQGVGPAAKTGRCCGLLVSVMSVLLLLGGGLFLLLGTVGGDICIDPNSSLQRGIAQVQSLNRIYVAEAQGQCQRRGADEELYGMGEPHVAELELLCYFQTCPLDASPMYTDLYLENARNTLAAASEATQDSSAPLNCEPLKVYTLGKLASLQDAVDYLGDLVSCQPVRERYRVLYHELFCADAMDIVYKLFVGNMIAGLLCALVTFVFIVADISSTSISVYRSTSKDGPETTYPDSPSWKKTTGMRGPIPVAKRVSRSDFESHPIQDSTVVNV